jgi:uncharacterized glyoxalase superfamily protein PhnB
VPNIENLRKQAKQIVRWHRLGYFPVAQILRDHLPRFASKSDCEIMESEFRLTDALVVVARQQGFKDWQALAKESNTMTNDIRSASRGMLLHAEPQLLVQDMPSCIAFYQKLGFEVAFEYGEPIFYCQVRRDGVALNLRHLDAPILDQSLREAESLLSATIVTDDVKTVFLQFKEAGIEFHEPLQSQPWGARTFIVKDPSGNLVLFA